MPSLAVRRPPSMFEDTLTIAYEVDGSQINANTLLPSLMAFVAAFEEINKALEPDQRLGINIQATAPGSFEVFIALFWQNIAGHLFQGHVTIPVMYKIFKEGLELKKLLGSEKPRKFKTEGDNAVVTNGNGNSIFVDRRTINIYNNNPNFEASIAEGMHFINSDDKVGGFRLASIGGDFTATKQDIVNMSKPQSADDSRTKTYLSKDAHLTILRPDFSGKMKWDFVFQGNKIQAWVDESYRSQVAKGERFGVGDVLVATVEITQVLDKQYNAYLNKSFKVTEVSRHIPAGEQTSML